MKDLVTKTLRFEGKGRYVQKQEGEARFYEKDGYAATFEAPEDHDEYGDIFERGAFAEDLEERGPDSTDNRYKVLDQHRWDTPIGIVSAAKEDDRGLLCTMRISLGTEAEPFEPGIKVARQIEDGIIDSLSVGFRLLGSEELEDTKTKWGWPVQKITKARFFEVSPVTFPANKFARIAKGLGALAAGEVTAKALTEVRDLLTELIDRAEARTEKAAPETEEKSAPEDASEVNDLVADMLTGIKAMGSLIQSRKTLNELRH